MLFMVSDFQKKVVSDEGLKKTGSDEVIYFGIKKMHQPKSSSGKDIASNIWRLVRGWCDLKIPTLSSCDEWDIWYTSWKASKV
ncbi:hypothetical protein Tco_0276500 [Tanacetum coccineum]